ncbi:MAG: hypothetical protein WDO24_31510 [Pseudomonadota bacterium]
MPWDDADALRARAEQFVTGTLRGRLKGARSTGRCRDRADRRGPRVGARSRLAGAPAGSAADRSEPRRNHRLLDRGRPVPARRHRRGDLRPGLDRRCPPRRRVRRAQQLETCASFLRRIAGGDGVAG